MQLARRTYLASTAAVATGGLAGCTDDGESEAGGDAGAAGDQQSLSLETYYPQPQGVSTDSERQSGNTDDFTIEVQNTGDAGDVGITLVWLETRDSDPWGTESEAVTSRERYYDADERRAVTITADLPDEYDAFGFRLWTPEIEAEIENPGPETRIAVVLKDGDEVLDEAELDADAGATVTHTFTLDSPDVKPAALRVEAETIE